MISTFKYHTGGYGNGSQFIDANISSYVNNFIAGWRDATLGNYDDRIIIWLRRGRTTHYYRSNFNVEPIVHDVNPLQEDGGPLHTYKTVPDSYVNPYGAVVKHRFTEVLHIIHRCKVNRFIIVKQNLKRHH